MIKKKKKEIKPKKVKVSKVMQSKGNIIVAYDGNAERDWAGKHWVKGDVKSLPARLKGQLTAEMGELEVDKSGKKLGFKIQKSTPKKIKKIVAETKEKEEIIIPEIKEEVVEK